MKKILFSLSAVMFTTILIITSFGGVAPAKAAAAQEAPKLVARTFSLDLGNGLKGLCVIAADGTQTCYRLDDPKYTDPTYGDCPEGWEVDPENEAQCRQFVDDSGYSYQPRPYIQATYKCPDETWTGPDQNGICSKVDVAGHFITQAQPYTEETTCPPDYLWSYTYEHPKGVFTTYTSLVSYAKAENDPHKCHRQPANILPTPTPGAVQGKYNQDNPEFVDGIVTRIYSDCSSLGTGWEADPAVAHQCRKWIDTTYVQTQQVVDVAAHYGDCPEGWEVDPENEAQCRQFVEGSHYNYQARSVIAGTPYCSEGTLVDGKCQVEIPCPPLECGEGEVYNPETQSCKPVDPCADGQPGRATNKACVKKADFSCHDRWVWLHTRVNVETVLRWMTHHPGYVFCKAWDAPWTNPHGRRGEQGR